MGIIHTVVYLQNKTLNIFNVNTRATTINTEEHFVMIKTLCICFFYNRSLFYLVNLIVIVILHFEIRTMNEAKIEFF